MTEDDRAAATTRPTAEHQRLQESNERTVHWNRWGPYLSERAWGTVREDYSEGGTAWEYFPHDHARSRAYRWNEDGIAGICDRHQYLCFSVAFWNERDPILKERLFGLTGEEGNHGEDVKECYYYLDNTPTHSYMKYLYRYPQSAYPYEDLVAENRRRGRTDPEYELLDTGVFDSNRFFDISVEYAKAGAEDILIRIQVTNRGPEPARLHLLPTLWFRNIWSWSPDSPRPLMEAANDFTIKAAHPETETHWLHLGGNPELLFTENETNLHRLYGGQNRTPYVKDGFNEYLIGGNRQAVNPARKGTRAAAHHLLDLEPSQELSVSMRLNTHSVIAPARRPPAEKAARGTGVVSTDGASRRSADQLPREGRVGADFDHVFATRQQEADEFYATVIPADLTEDARSVMRQSFAGLLWSKQYYHYVVYRWLKGDPAFPPPPEQRWDGRNHEWQHLYNEDVISMPDKWEYPWYAAWDLAFHCISLSLVDPDFAKEQLTLMLREWYMHPSGQLPAYEWAFGDVNPPVHAWAALRVFQIEEKRKGKGDFKFLERVFLKLLLNFTWWVNRKDASGMNIFQGGFLGLDNIGVFDRSAPLPTGGYIEQSDGTSWMAMYALNMLAIALELSRHDESYQDMASKFWEHFLYIAHAMNNLGPEGIELWNEEDSFFYDVLHLDTGQRIPMKVRSMVGLIPLFAVETLESSEINRLHGFRTRSEWFIRHRTDLTLNVASMDLPGHKQRRLLAIIGQDQLRLILRVMLDENEFLSPHGLRALSRYHKDHPYTLCLNGASHQVDYEPAESTSRVFGGNSNWRGPVWMPLNYLIIESLQKFHYYLGDDYKVECPTGSGTMMNLWEVSVELSRRLTRIFLKDESGERPVFGDDQRLQRDPLWRDLVCFYEYFNGDTGKGLGASHQTGWTGLVAKLLQQSGESPPGPRAGTRPHHRPAP